jgi:hypothetical protein
MADEGLTLNPNGTIDVTLGEKSYRLRRPNFGELRRLWEAWDEAAEKHDSLIADADKRDDRTLRVGRAEAWLAFQRVVFDTISEPLPEDGDEVAGWLLTASVGSQFLAHWQAVPKASG